MNHTFLIGRRVFQQLFHDRRFFVVSIVGPLLIIGFNAAPIKIQSGLLKAHSGKIRRTPDGHQHDIGMDCFFFALCGGVLHVVTVNDYLARRGVSPELARHS